MNKERRKELEKVIEQLQALSEQLDILSEEESEALENLPESLQSSERGEKMEDDAGTIDNAAVGIMTIAIDIQEVIEA